MSQQTQTPVQGEAQIIIDKVIELYYVIDETDGGQVGVSGHYVYSLCDLTEDASGFFLKINCWEGSLHRLFTMRLQKLGYIFNEAYITERITLAGVKGPLLMATFTKKLDEQTPVLCPNCDHRAKPNKEHPECCSRCGSSLNSNASEDRCPTCWERDNDCTCQAEV